MNIEEMIFKVRDALASDQDLTNWCREKFSRPPIILTGVDDNNPPAETDYPVIAIIDVTCRRGNTRGRISIDVTLGCGVVQETIEHDAAAGTRTCLGFIQAETLRSLTEEALAKARFARLTFLGDTAGISSFPEFVSFTTITIETVSERRR